jgi:hypothetical protein
MHVAYPHTAPEQLQEGFFKLKVYYRMGWRFTV